ncbi:MAG: tetratricopeptide repeat protein [Pseudomonadota bacterium]
MTLSFDAFEAFAREYEGYARERDISMAALERFFATLVLEKVPLNKVDGKLDEIAEAHLRARAELRHFRPHDDVAALLEQADQANEDGRSEDFERLVAEVEVKTSANVEAAQQETHALMRVDAKAAALPSNPRLARLDYAGAVDALRAAINKLPEGDPLAAEYLTRLSDAYRQWGRFGDAQHTADAALVVVAQEETERAANAWRAKALAARELGAYDSAGQALHHAHELARRIETGEDLAQSLALEHTSLLMDLGLLGEAAEELTDDTTQTSQTSRAAALSRARQLEVLGRLHKERADWAAAKHAIKAALEIKAAVLAQGHPGSMRTLADLAFVCQKLGEYEVALNSLTTAAARLEHTVGPEHPEMVTLHDMLGGFYAERGDLPQAEDHYRRAIALAETVLGPQHPDLAQSWSNLGTVLMVRGEAERATRHFERAHRLFTDNLGAEHPETAASVHNLAAALYKRGQLQDAMRHCEDALARRDALFGPTSPITADTLVLRATLLHHMGQGREAIADQQAALDNFESAHGLDHVRSARTRMDLARMYLDLGEVRAALSPARRALLSLLRWEAPPCELVLLALNNLGHAMMLSERPARAVVLLRWALDYRRRSADGETEQLVLSLVNLAAALAAVGRSEEARDLHVETIEIGTRVWPRGHFLCAAAMNNLGKFHEARQETSEAERLFTEALEMMVTCLGADHPHTRAVAANLHRLA